MIQFNDTKKKVRFQKKDVVAISLTGNLSWGEAYITIYLKKQGLLFFTSKKKPYDGLAIRCNRRGESQKILYRLFMARKDSKKYYMAKKKIKYWYLSEYEEELE